MLKMRNLPPKRLKVARSTVKMTPTQAAKILQNLCKGWQAWIAGNNRHTEEDEQIIEALKKGMEALRKEAICRKK